MKLAGARLSRLSDETPRPQLNVGCLYRFCLHLHELLEVGVDLLRNVDTYI